MGRPRGKRKEVIFGLLTLRTTRVLSRLSLLFLCVSGVSVIHDSAETGNRAVAVFGVSKNSWRQTWEENWSSNTYSARLWINNRTRRVNMNDNNRVPWLGYTEDIVVNDDGDEVSRTAWLIWSCWHCMTGNNEEFIQKLWKISNKKKGNDSWSDKCILVSLFRGTPCRI